MDPATPHVDSLQGRDDLEALLRRHEFALRRAYEQGRKEHGSLPLAFESFARRVLALLLRRLLASSLGAGEARIAKALSALAGADLFLAIACDGDVEGAWEALTQCYIDRMRGLALRHGAAAAQADELSRELPGLLSAPPPTGDTRTRIGTFDGTGNLFSWLAVIVLRRLADRGRARARRAQTGLEGVDAAAPPSGDPAAATLDGETADRLRMVLREVWPTLTRQESVALLWKYRDGLRQNEIARLLGVGKSRVSRIVSGAVAKLRHGVARRFSDGAQPAAGDHLWATLHSAVQDHLATLRITRDPPFEGPLGNG